MSGVERIIATMPRHSQRFGVAAYNFLGKRFGTGVTQGISSASNSLMSFNDALGAVGINLGGVARAGTLGVVGGLVAVGAAATAATVKLGMLGAEYGVQAAKFAVETTSFQEDSLTTLQVLLRDKAAANRVFSQAVKIAAETPFETNEAIEGVKQLIAGGFKEPHIDRMMRSMSDMASVTGDRQAMHRVIYAIKQIKSMDKLRSEELNLQLGEAGLPVATVRKHLQQLMGLKNQDEVEKMMRKGKINANTGITAILKTIDEKFLGASEARSKTMSGLLSTLVSRPSELIYAANNDEKAQGGFNAIKGMVLELTQLLDANSSTGSSIVAMFREIGAASADVFKGISMREILLSVIDAVRVIMPDIKLFFSELGAGFRSVAPNGTFLQITFQGLMNAARIAIPVVAGFVRGLALGLGPLFGTLAGADVQSWGVRLGRAAEYVGFCISGTVSAVSLLMGGLASLLGSAIQIGDWFLSLGKSIIDGVVKGIQQVGPKVWEALKTVFKVTIANAGLLLQINSPSRVFARMGESSGLGYGLGFASAGVSGFVTGTLRDSVAVARRSAHGFGSMLGMGATVGGHFGLEMLTPQVSPLMLQRGVAGLTGGGLSVGEVHISVPVHLSGGDSATREAAEQAVVRLLPSALDDALQRLALELGA